MITAPRIAAGLLLSGVLSGCLGLGGGGGDDNSGRALTTAEGVEPGHASCLASIGRPDVAMDPGAELTKSEITDFLGCISERASG